MKRILIGLSLFASLSAHSFDKVEMEVYSEEVIQGTTEVELESKCKGQSMRREINLIKATNTAVNEFGKVPWIYNTIELENLRKLNKNSVHYELTEIKASGWIDKTYSGTCTVYDNTDKLFQSIESMMYKVSDCYEMIENTKINKENGKLICESTNQICHLILLYDMKLDNADYAKVSPLCNPNIITPQKCHDEFTSGNTISESSSAFGGYTGGMAIQMCDSSNTIKSFEEGSDWSLLKELDLVN